MKKKGFTLIELIAVLVIVVIIFLIATVLVKNVIAKSRKTAQKRSIDAYGHAIELAASEYLLDTGTKANDINLLNIKYTGSNVVCDVSVVYENNVYLTKCSVDGIVVKDKKNMNGYYSYGDIIKFGDIYSNAVKNAILRYKIQNRGQIPSHIDNLDINLDNLDFSCDNNKINSDESYYLSNCNLSGIEVLSNNTNDGYYHWGEEKYFIGDIVYYNEMPFYVIENSDYSTETVHLMKKEPIKTVELESYLGEIGLQDKIEINSSDDYLKVKYCYTGNCSYDYSKSDLKRIVDLWGDKYINNNDLVKDDSGYKIRIPNDTDVFNNLQYHIGIMSSYNGDGGGTELHYTTELDFRFSGIWCSAKIDDSDYSVTSMNSNFLYVVYTSYENNNNNNGILYVSPVINIKKSALYNQ